MITSVAIKNNICLCNLEYPRVDIIIEAYNQKKLVQCKWIIEGREPFDLFSTKYEKIPYEMILIKEDPDVILTSIIIIYKCYYPKPPINYLKLCRQRIQTPYVAMTD